MSFLSAALLVCSGADHSTVDRVVVAAHAAATDPVPLLALGCIESGLKGRNVLGVRACYAGKNLDLDQADCIAVGVRSWKNRLVGARDLHHAFRRYNNATHRVRYADKAVKLTTIIRRNLGKDQVR